MHVRSGIDDPMLRQYHDYLDSFLSENTAKQYVSVTRQLGRALVELRGLPDNELQFLLNKQIKIKSRSYHTRFALLHLLKFLGKYNIKLRLPKKQARRIGRKHLNFSEIKRIIRYCDRESNLLVKLTAMLQYETASRISSLLLLKNSPTDIDFEENLLYLIEPKTNERFVRRVSNKAMETLTSYIQNNNIGENQKIIQLSYYKVWYRQKKVFKKLGYENVSSHWFRGSRLIHLFKKGWTIVDIKEFSKHARLESLYPYLQDSGIESKKKQRELKVEW